jgi:hypothetical protein
MFKKSMSRQHIGNRKIIEWREVAGLVLLCSSETNETIFSGKSQPLQIQKKLNP